MKRFSDFSTSDGLLIGDKVKLDSILGKEITIKGYKVSDSKYNNGNSKVLTIHFELNGIDYILFTGSRVLISQTEKYAEEIPFLAKIEKLNNFYSYS